MCVMENDIEWQHLKLHSKAVNHLEKPWAVGFRPTTS